MAIADNFDSGRNPKLACSTDSDGVATPKVTLVSQGAVGYPVGATPIIAASGNVANAIGSCTLSSAGVGTVYIAGFEITAAGATSALSVVATVTGVLGGTLSYVFGAPLGATVPAAPLVVRFIPPLPAADASTNIVVSLPALGTGNTNAAIVAHGFGT